MGHSIVFEPSYRHRSNYIDCHTYEGLVTLDEQTASSGSFDIIMTNNSNRYVKVTKNQTLGMLQSCDADQMCTIHRIVTFEPKPFEREGIKPKPLEKEVTNPNHSKNINVISSINTQPVSGNIHENRLLANSIYRNIVTTVPFILVWGIFRISMGMPNTAHWIHPW